MSSCVDHCVSRPFASLSILRALSKHDIRKPERCCTDVSLRPEFTARALHSPATHGVSKLDVYRGQSVHAEQLVDGRFTPPTCSLFVPREEGHAFKNLNLKSYNFCACSQSFHVRFLLPLLVFHGKGSEGSCQPPEAHAAGPATAAWAGTSWGPWGVKRWEFRIRGPLPPFKGSDV